LVKPATVLSLGLTSLLLGALAGCVIAAAGGPLVYVFGVVGLFCAFFYSATARSLSSLALGELASFLVFGPLITCGAYLVMAQTGVIVSTAFTYSIPLGLFAAAAIHVNNMRDIEGDAHAKRLTLASILGMRWSRWLYGLLLLVAYLLVVVITLPHGAPHFMLLTLWTLPLLVVAITGIIRSGTASGMHLLMRQTIRLETYFALFLLIGLLITALIPVLPNLPAHLIP
jgi:1,4-dihydroxy-2-naphthoate octaprenyltransferase